jgi:hypothetical protein
MTGAHLIALARSLYRHAHAITTAATAAFALVQLYEFAHPLPREAAVQCQYQLHCALCIDRRAAPQLPQLFKGDVACSSTTVVFL